MKTKHSKTTLSGWSKKRLIEHAMMLEYNYETIQQSFDNQYSNCMKLIEDMNLLNQTYKDSKK